MDYRANKLRLGLVVRIIIRCVVKCDPIYRLVKWKSNDNTRTRVRTILALGYWILGNICTYWVVLLLRDIFSLWHPIRYQSDSSQHRPHDNCLDICGAAIVSWGWQAEWGGGRVQAIHHHHTVLRFYGYSVHECCIYFASKSIHCYAIQ